MRGNQSWYSWNSVILEGLRPTTHICTLYSSYMLGIHSLGVSLAGAYVKLDHGPLSRADRSVSTSGGCWWMGVVPPTDDVAYTEKIDTALTNESNMSCANPFSHLIIGAF